MSWSQGFWWPWGTKPMPPANSTTVLDATGEYFAIIGRINIAGQATSKTLSSSGGTFTFAVNSSPVFDQTASEFTVGIKDVDKTTGIPVRPGSTWGARARITTDAHTVAGDASANTSPTFTTSSDYHVATVTAGSSTLSHGQEVALVFEFTTKAVSDAISILTWSSRLSSDILQYPTAVTNITGSVAGDGRGTCSCLITFDDGTLGIMEDCFFSSAGVTSTNLTWKDADAIDEYGLIFQVPFACSVDAIGFEMLYADAASDLQFDLTSDPTVTPASLISGPIALTAENARASAALGWVQASFAPVALAANTDYCIGVKATSTSNLRWQRMTLPSAASRSLASCGGTTVSGATRSGGTGAYAATTTTLHPLAVRICDITGGGGLRLAGHGGLAA